MSRKNKTSPEKKTPPAPPSAPARPFLSSKAATVACIAALVLVCIVFFHKVIFGVANFWEDLIYQEFPHRIFARDCLIHFSFPHWNPYTFGGMPFFAATHTGVLYPANLLLSFLPLDRGPFWYALELSIVLHIAIAGIAMFFLCTYCRLSRLSSLFAALSYMLCGFFVVHIIHSLMLYILAWLPLIMRLMLRGTQENKPKDFISAGLVLGLTTLAGHPQITFYEFLFLGAFALYVLFCVSKRRVFHALLLGALFAVAGGLAMVLFLPAAELSKESARVVWTYQMASEGSMSFRQLFTLIVPKLFGGTNSANPWREELSFWLNDSYHSGYWTFWETTFYTGIAVFAFGMAQFVNIRRSRFVFFCALWCGFSLLVALGSHTPFYHLLFAYVPGFHTFRAPARILATWNLLLPLLAARTIEELKTPDGRRRLLLPLSAAGGICLLSGLSVASNFASQFCAEFTRKEYGDYASRQSVIMLGMLTLAAVPVLLYYRSRISHRAFKTAVLAALALDLFIFGIDYHIVNYSPGTYFSRNRELADYLSAENRKELFRTKMREGGVMLLDRNQGMMDKIFLMEGYNPLNLFRHTVPASKQAQLDLFNVKYAISIDTMQNSAGLVENSGCLPRAKMFYRAVVLENDSAVKRYQESDAFRYREEVVLVQKPSVPLPVEASGPDSAVITGYGNNRIELSVSTARNGILWLSEVWYPAWKAFIDGKETAVLRADYSFMAVALEKGRHTVVFQYASSAFNRGLAVSLGTLLAAIAALLFFSYSEAAVSRSRSL